MSEIMMNDINLPFDNLFLSPSFSSHTGRPPSPNLQEEISEARAQRIHRYQVGRVS